MLLKIAIRNIGRNARRSLIIIVAVSIGLWAGIFLMAFYNGMIQQRINSAITGEISHLQLHHPQFKDDHDIQYYLQDGRKILQQITENPNVKAAVGRIVLNGMLASASGSSGITINGVMPEAENSLTHLNQKILEGHYFQPKKTNELILSQRLCKKLNVTLNKKVILTFQDSNGDLVSAAFRIAAIYKTVNDPYDDINVFVNIHPIDSLAGIPTQFNEIAVLLHSSKLLDQTQIDFEKRFPQTRVENWMEIAPELGLIVSMGDQMVYIFMGIILLALAFGIVNTMMMAVLERTREIGMLLALGMNKIKIFLMILMETLFLLLVGCPLGIGLALGTVALTHRTGIDFSNFSEVYSRFGYESVIYPALVLNQLGSIMLLVVITAILSALFPARRALKLKPAEALKK